MVPFSTKLKQAESEALVGHIAPRVVLFDATVQDWLKNTPDARAVSLSEWQALCLPEPLTRPPVPVNRDDTAVMMFTSGTTGEPKGAIITHNNLLCAIDAYTQKLNLTAADSTILAVPIYHITGLSALLALFISLGASIWLQHRFNAPQVITTLREQNITFLHGSPTIFILLCQAAREAERQPSRRFSGIAHDCLRRGPPERWTDQGVKNPVPAYRDSANLRPHRNDLACDDFSGRRLGQR